VWLCLLDIEIDLSALRSGPARLRQRYPTPLQVWTPSLAGILEEEPDYKSGIPHSAATHVVYFKFFKI